MAVPIGMLSPLSPFLLAQHPYEHRPQDPVLLAVDQEFGEGATLWVAPELADPVGAVEVWEVKEVKGMRSLYTD